MPFAVTESPSVSAVITTPTDAYRRDALKWTMPVADDGPSTMVRYALLSFAYGTAAKSSKKQRIRILKALFGLLRDCCYQ